MPKILNLDALSEQASRELVLAGKTYKIKETTVDDFIEMNKVAQELEKRELTMEEQINETINLISKSIPEIEVATLRGLSLDQLRAIAAFVRGVEPEVIVGVIAGTTKPAEGDAAGKL